MKGTSNGRRFYERNLTPLLVIGALVLVILVLRLLFGIGPE